MRKRFVVLLDSCNEDQDGALQVYIKGLEVGWWHWLPGVWLIHQTIGELTARKLRDDLMELLPGMNMLVLELSDDDKETWSGYGPKAEGQNMFDWINRYWAKSMSIPKDIKESSSVIPSDSKHSE